ncbi:MAG: sorbosone dehydrogenase family protein [Chloroflexi bacterium]|nr:sorbosone dehydrogenase family protein [Chloroflexota bacterium]
MDAKTRSGLNWKRLIAVLAVLLLIGGAVLYRQIARQVNLIGFFVDGSEATVFLPDGFKINVFAEGLNGPRFIHFDPQGRLFVAERGADQVVILVDEDGDGVADTKKIFAAGLNSPHSLVFHSGAWYVGLPNGIVRLIDQDGDDVVDERVTVIGNYPTNGHNTRTVEFLPDGRMVVSVGSSCNVCEEDDPRRASVLIYDNDGERIFASGLRNAVGLAIHPQTGQLWATNNGRDLMGDNLPPDNIYLIREGANYGWPSCHSGVIEDPKFGTPGACEGVELAVVDLQAHSAPLGLVFYTGDTFPEEYWGDLFIAYHGSWNRSIPTGYKVVRLPFDGTQAGAEVVDFASGWLEEGYEKVTGRPVGLAVGRDGALYISDDEGGFIYRIQYTRSEQ